MKKAIILGLMSAALVLAQPGGMGGGGGDTGGGMGSGSGMGRGGSGGGGEMGGGGMMPSMPTPMERWSTALALNKDQKKEVKGIMDDGQKEAAPLRDQLLKGRQNIAQVVAAGKSQDDINAAINEYAATQAKMTQIELRCFAKIFAVLDKDQQAKSPQVLLMSMNGIFKNKNWDSNPPR